ncbi:methyl-accepting chemotaxis protein [Sphingomonas sp. NCPPB 2930]
MDKPEGVDLDIGWVPVRMPQARKLAVASGRVNDAVIEVRDATAAMESANSELAGDSERLRDRTARVTDNLEKTASSIDEIAATVTRSRDAARDGRVAALRAADATATGSTLMRDMADRMNGIAQSSQSIGNIVALIDGIAFQTNILALNAAVEAARAGDHGRGFAVVVAEVRSLSQRSALAAREIKTLIDTSSTQVSQGGAIVGNVDQAMAGIGDTVEQTTALMKAIDLAAAEQQAGIDHVNESVAQIEAMTQQNAQLATASAASALRMQTQIARLSRAVQAFHSSGADMVAALPLPLNRSLAA